VEVLPNPARDQITMRGLPAGSLVLRIIDAQGRVVVDQQQRHGGGDLFVGLEGLAAGGYHVQARVNDQRFQARLVVQP
jgi:hypothetical protein